MNKITKKKNFDYFDAFKQITMKATAAADYLQETLVDFPFDGFELRADEMHKIENDADAIKHEIIEHLAHEFITPIEREDIVALAQALDTVVDTIDDVMRRLYMFNIKEIRVEILEFSELISKACLALEAAVAEFRNFKSSKTISSLIIEVNSLEDKGDALHFKYLHKLFSEDSNDKLLISWMTIIESLEECFDACEDAADIIESVIMKNS